MNASTRVSSVISTLTARTHQPERPALEELRFPASSPTSSLDPPPRIDEDDDETIRWVEHLSDPNIPRIEAPVMGLCSLCGRPAAPVGPSIEVNGSPLELCGPCLGLPLAVILLHLRVPPRQGPPRQGAPQQ